MIASYSVIIPVLNKHKEIVATLNSVEKSMEYFDATHPQANEVTSEVIIVDEGSNDGTLEAVRDFTSNRPRFRLVNHFRSLGIAAARNTGVRLARGAILFFC